MKTLHFGVYSVGIYPSLTTPDKQLHCHGEIYKWKLTQQKRTLAKFWEAIGFTLAFLEKELPDDIFTLVLNDSPVI